MRPGAFVLTTKIKGMIFRNYLIDSGASENVFLSCFYNPFIYPPLKPMKTQIGMVNGEINRPHEKMEDDLVHIAGVTLLQHFLVMD